MTVTRRSCRSRSRRSRSPEQHAAAGASMHETTQTQEDEPDVSGMTEEEDEPDVEKDLMNPASAYYLECRRVIWPDVFGADGTLLKNVKRSTVPTSDARIKKLIFSIAPARLNVKPTKDVTDLVKIWSAATFCGISRKSMMSHLRKLNLHAGIEAAMEPEKDEAIVSLTFAINKERKALGDCYITYARVEAVVEQLRVFRGLASVSMSNVGDLPLDLAAEFCTAKNGRFRPSVLMNTGFRHGLKELQAASQELNELKEKFFLLRKGTGVLGQTAKFCSYIYLHRHFGGLHQLGKQTNEQLLACITEYTSDKQHRAVYVLLSAELKRQGLDDVVKWLDLRVPFIASGLSASARFKLHSEWRAGLLDEVVNIYTRDSERKTSHAKEKSKNLANFVAYGLVNISAFVLDKKQEFLVNDEDELKWFLCNADIEMCKEMLRHAGESLAVHNDRVKDQYSPHHATAKTVQLIRLLKRGLVGRLTICGPFIEALKMQTVLSTIPDMRECSGVRDKRRTYNDDEYNKLFSYAITSRERFYLTILREIGIRNGAIFFMKFQDLIGEDLVARHTCSVLEKLNKFRTFVSGPNVKRYSQEYYDDYRRIHATHGDCRQCYVMNLDNPTARAHKGYGNKLLTRLATLADISEVVVHPHAFRHTLTGKMISAGNSVELTSKFLGHSQVGTTFSRYWVPTAQALADQMKNPFNQGSVKPQHMEDTKAEESLRAKKIQKCMEIIFAYNTILAKNVNAGGTALHVQKEIFLAMPTLGQILSTIEFDPDLVETDSESSPIRRSYTSEDDSDAKYKGESEGEHHREGYTSDEDDADMADASDTM